MPNNGWKPSRCRSCNKPATARRQISFRGKCGPCAERAITRNATNIARKRGPEYDRWRAGVVAAASRLVEEMSA